MISHRFSLTREILNPWAAGHARAQHDLSPRWFALYVIGVRGNISRFLKIDAETLLTWERNRGNHGRVSEPMMAPKVKVVCGHLEDILFVEVLTQWPRKVANSLYRAMSIEVYRR